uniref:Tetraspanin n=1 Tax=Timema genevievae TaxID=629358 RepID=A0A7R9PQ53_TIMGE|nr:unnamed protein product [Timema genevievae]
MRKKMDFPVSPNKGLQCIKYILFIFNFIYMLTGIMVIAAGSSSMAILSRYDSFLESSLYSPSALLIVIGIMIGMVAFLGCFGAAKESTCVIMVFSWLLCGIFVLELSAGIAALVNKNCFYDLISSNMKDVMKVYTKDPAASEIFDFIQQRMQCCGVESYQDWSQILSEDPYRKDDRYNLSVVPWSCCQSPSTGMEGLNWRNCDMAYQTGCVVRVHSILMSSTNMIITAAFTLALLQVGESQWSVVECRVETTFPHALIQVGENKWSVVECRVGTTIHMALIQVGENQLSAVECRVGTTIPMAHLQVGENQLSVVNCKVGTNFPLELLQVGDNKWSVVEFKVSGAVLAFSLAHRIRRAKTERDFIRWELSESVNRNYSPLHLTDPTGSVPIVKNRELMGSIY